MTCVRSSLRLLWFVRMMKCLPNKYCLHFVTVSTIARSSLKYAEVLANLGPNFLRKKEIARNSLKYAEVPANLGPNFLLKEGDGVTLLHEYSPNSHTGGIILYDELFREIEQRVNECFRHSLLEMIKSSVCLNGPLKIILLQ